MEEASQKVNSTPPGSPLVTKVSAMLLAPQLSSSNTQSRYSAQYTFRFRLIVFCVLEHIAMAFDHWRRLPRDEACVHEALNSSKHTGKNTWAEFYVSSQPPPPIEEERLLTDVGRNKNGVIISTVEHSSRYLQPIQSNFTSLPPSGSSTFHSPIPSFLFTY